MKHTGLPVSFLIGIATALVGCSSIPQYGSPKASTQIAQAIRSGWQTNESTSDFVTLRRPGSSPVATTYVFFEGDGRAWQDGGRAPPDDPTPSNSLALKLTLEVEPTDTAIYIGRSCQFIQQTGRHAVACNPSQWSTARFSRTYLSEVVDYLKPLLVGQRHVIFVGHSGGGTVATLAAQELQPTCLVTMAAPIDTETWTKNLGLEPLGQSLNPSQGMSGIPTDNRIHYYGGRDAVVPLSGSGLTEHSERVVLKASYTHNRGWYDLWQDIKANPCAHDK